MARFDVYRVNGEYYLDVQTNLLPSMGSRLVIPLVSADHVVRPVRKLHPSFNVAGQELVAATHLMVAVPERSLGAPVGNARAHYDAIVAAIDMIFLGF
jgi:toxin CcdB